MQISDTAVLPIEAKEFDYLNANGYIPPMPKDCTLNFDGKSRRVTLTMELDETTTDLAIFKQGIAYWLKKVHETCEKQKNFLALHFRISAQEDFNNLVKEVLLDKGWIKKINGNLYKGK